MALLLFMRTAFRDPKLAKVADYFYSHISDPGPVPLAAAARMLDGSTRIGAAAEASGYSDPSTFARAFKLYQGITARQLMNLLRVHPELEPALRLSPAPKVVLELTLVPSSTVAALSLVARLLVGLDR